MFLSEGTSADDRVLVEFVLFCLTYVDFVAKALGKCLYTDKALTPASVSHFATFASGGGGLVGWDDPPGVWLVRPPN